MPEAKPKKVTVLLHQTEFDRLNSYCRELGYKKSPLIARLVRDYLNDEEIKFQNQTDKEKENVS